MQGKLPAALVVSLLAVLCPLCARGLAAEEASAAGNVYYLSEAGSDDNAGSEAAPWRTFVRANKSVRPGDTVRVLPGHYEGAKLNAKGTAGKPITYVSVEPRKAIVDLGGFPAQAFLDGILDGRAGVLGDGKTARQEDETERLEGCFHSDLGLFFSRQERVTVGCTSQCTSCRWPRRIQLRRA